MNRYQVLQSQLFLWAPVVCTQPEVRYFKAVFLTVIWAESDVNLLVLAGEVHRRESYLHFSLEIVFVPCLQFDWYCILANLNQVYVIARD